jgi:hypothetical protein
VFGAGLPTDVDDQIALVAFAGDDDVAVVPASFESGGQTVEAEVIFVDFLRVAIEAVGLEDGLNVLGVGDAFLGGGGRQLGEVNGEDRGGHAQGRKDGEADCGGDILMSHDNLWHCNSNVWPSDGGRATGVTLAAIFGIGG